MNGLANDLSNCFTEGSVYIHQVERWERWKRFLDPKLEFDVNLYEGERQKLVERRRELHCITCNFEFFAILQICNFPTTHSWAFSIFSSYLSHNSGGFFPKPFPGPYNSSACLTLQRLGVCVRAPTCS